MCKRAAQYVPVPVFSRAGGACVCKLCGYDYYSHPNAVPHIWLRLLCDGRYVKL